MRGNPPHPQFPKEETLMANGNLSALCLPRHLFLQYTFTVRQGLKAIMQSLPLSHVRYCGEHFLVLALSTSSVHVPISRCTNSSANCRAMKSKQSDNSRHPISFHYPSNKQSLQEGRWDIRAWKVSIIQFQRLMNLPQTCKLSGAA